MKNPGDAGNKLIIWPWGVSCLETSRNLFVATLATVNRASYFSKKGNNPTYVREIELKKKIQKQLKNMSASDIIHV